MTASIGLPPSIEPGRDDVIGAIRRGSSASGGDFAAMVRVASLESGFDADAQAATSSARGVFQFTRGTWLEMVRRHGAEHGLEAEAHALAGEVDRETEARILALRDDPELSARMAGELTRDNARVLQARTGVEPETSDLYLAHFLGAGGAARFISAEQAGEGNNPADAIFPRAAAANRAVFYEDGRARSLSEVRAFFERKLAAVNVPREGAPTPGHGGVPMSAGTPAVASESVPQAREAMPAGAGSIGHGRAFSWLTPVSGGLISHEARLALAELSAPGERTDESREQDRGDTQRSGWSRPIWDFG